MEADSVAHVRLLVSAEREAQLDCTVTLSGTADVMTTLEELYVGENAHLTYQMLQQAPAEVSYAQRRASVNDDGSLTHLSGIFGPEFARERFQTELKGDNAHLDTYNCW
ncbi:MAG: SufD family Fe-S cluster assembly protein, partial [Candidatus Nanohaloarchaea archaeon]|nr:SufD family Fe-S cluster assembly protein [Candidatus Nanohaloarchaea archaeon]